ncbi:MAG: T9SS type A sorting domain-containing protein, partial [Ignavibacteriaceae bacterium]|nr:T9SS type A sorting domain-containing protein [Ignavibacteriaceae bacterium]
FYVGAHGYKLHSGQYVVSDFFDGQIDELRIWNSQKNSQQIIALKDAPLDAAYYNTIDSGLVGYWRFDLLEDLGINNDGPDDVKDLSVLHNHLDLAGNAHLVSYGTITTNIFEKTFGGIEPERGIQIDLTDDGGYMIVGSTESFTSGEIMFVLKLDSAGTLQWNKVYDAYGYGKLTGVKQTSDGGYYIAGFIEGGFGFLDQFIMKTDMIGNVLWAKNFGGIEADEFRKLSITAGGGLVVAGSNASFGVGAKDAQAIKINTNGDVEWAKTYGTLYEDFNSSCIIASDGNYVLSGAVDITGSYGIRPTLIKLDTLGNIIWAKYYSGYIEDWARDVIETSDGGFLITGDTRSFGLGGSQDVYLIKTNSGGNVEWAKSYGGIGSDVGYGVVLSNDGKYLVAGYTNSFGFGGYDGLLMKVDTTGSIEWFRTYGGYTSDYIYDLIVGSDNGFALTGRRSSNTLGGDDVWLVKTDANGFSNCAFGDYNPNVFTISNLQALNMNMGIFSYISAATPNLTTIIPNSSQTTSCAIIPVELKSFNYKIENNNVVLNWSTATELNNQGFKIVREGNEIGFVAGSGTTTEPREYSFNDENVKPGNYLYELIQIDFDGSSVKAAELEVTVNNIPSEYILQQNYPNPFNPKTIIGFALPRNANIKLSVYNTLGESIAVIVDGFKESGYYQTEFDGSNLPSGIYFYTLSSDNFISTKKMMLLK